MYIKKILLGVAFLLFSGQLLAADVYVIAHSISTRAEARRVMQKQGWGQATNPAQASGILVVCRSGLSYPLNSPYKTIKELDEDADSQLNISGSNFHVYVFNLNGNKTVSEAQHIYYPAND
ncbi:hypothetical protein G6681_05590 [Polynucleobacter paneuropaeus]|nr:hypothetical protein G6681_05590 [Polynucleobacter paneuropaeus]